MKKKTHDALRKIHLKVAKGFSEATDSRERKELSMYLDLIDGCCQQEDPLDWLQALRKIPPLGDYQKIQMRYIDRLLKHLS